MSSLSKTARLQISAVSLPEIPVCTGSPFLQRCWTLSCSNLPVLLSRLCRSQSQTAARPIRHRCLPDIRRQRRLFFCSFCGTRSVSVSRYGSHRFPAASAVLRATSCFSFNSGTDTVRPSTWRAHSTKTWQAWIYRKAAANFSREPENRVQKVLYGASLAGHLILLAETENSANGISWLILVIGSK